MAKRVMVFTASGTFRGQEGEITEERRDGAMVKIDGELAPMLFKTNELVRLEPDPHIGGAE